MSERGEGQQMQGLAQNFDAKAKLRYHPQRRRGVQLRNAKDRLGAASLGHRSEWMSVATALNRAGTLRQSKARTVKASETKAQHYYAKPKHGMAFICNGFALKINAAEKQAKDKLRKSTGSLLRAMELHRQAKEMNGKGKRRNGIAHLRNGFELSRPAMCCYGGAMNAW